MNHKLSFLQRYAFVCSCFLFLFLLAANVAQAQTDTTQTQGGKRERWLVETKDGSTFQGVFLWQDETGIRLLTESVGEITIPASNIKSHKVLDDTNFKKGVYWFENPNATRYLFSPSAFSLRKGEAYYQNTYLFLNSFNYGLTDNFTIGAGFELISTFSGEPIYFLTPKYSFPISEKLRGGAGIFYGNSTVSSDFSGLGIGYGILTYGSMDNNATLGVGYGFVDRDLAKRPIFTLSGMKRVSRKIGLVTENWFVPGLYDHSLQSYYGAYSYGLRFMGEKLTVDLAFINNSDIAQDVLIIGIPYVDFVVKFGK